MSKVLNQLYFKLFYKYLNDSREYIEDKFNDCLNYHSRHCNMRYLLKSTSNTLINKLTFLNIEKKINDKLLKIIGKI